MIIHFHWLFPNHLHLLSLIHLLLLLMNLLLVAIGVTIYMNTFLLLSHLLFSKFVAILLLQCLLLIHSILVPLHSLHSAHIDCHQHAVYHNYINLQLTIYFIDDLKKRHPSHTIYLICIYINIEKKRYSPYL